MENISPTLILDGISMVISVTGTNFLFIVITNSFVYAELKVNPFSIVALTLTIPGFTVQKMETFQKILL